MNASSSSNLTDDQVAELWRLFRHYMREATRCEESRAWLAGCVMLGSALETLLLLMIDAHSEEALGTGKAPTKKGYVKPLLTWRLTELVRVARAANWLPYGLEPGEDWSHRRAKIGDYAMIANEIRNLVHAARYLEDYAGKRITAARFRFQFDIVEHCRRWLLSANNQRLRESLDRDDRDHAVGDTASRVSRKA